MPQAAKQQELAGALRELHHALMECARRDYEREHGSAPNPGELLRLLTSDAHFEWLRRLSELMVDIDVVIEAEPQLADETAATVRAAVEHFITPPAAAPAESAFAQRYWPYLQADAHVAMAHARVKRALAAWPVPPKPDAANLLHERHRLAERARHHSRKR